MNPALFGALDRCDQMVRVPDGAVEPEFEFLDCFAPIVRIDSPLPQNLNYIVRRRARLRLVGPHCPPPLRSPADNLQILLPR